MTTKNLPSSRRKFFTKVASGAAMIGVATLANPLDTYAEKMAPKVTNPNDPDEWFKQIKGKHRIVFDSTQPHEIFPFAWPKVFLMTNEVTGTQMKDSSVVVVLRHASIPYAFSDNLWKKYKFGEVFKADDPLTKKPAERNPFWKPNPGDFKIPGVGPVAIGLNELQKDGVLFCVCDMAITVYSAALAEGSNQQAADVKKEWLAGLLPGIQVVPSGVWALGRAQEHGCGYIFAG